MSIQQFVQSVIDRLQGTATVKTVYGEPMEVKGKTIIPVARVAYGFGVDSKSKTKSTSDELGPRGGGGVMVRPTGVLEITTDTTRFIPIMETRKLMWAALMGFCLGVLLTGRRSRED